MPNLTRREGNIIFVALILQVTVMCIFIYAMSGTSKATDESYHNGFRDGLLYAANYIRSKVGLPSFKDWKELEEFSKERKKEKEEEKENENDESPNSDPNLGPSPSQNPRERFSKPYVMG